MKTTTNSFNDLNTVISSLGVESTKRLMSFCASKFPSKDTSKAKPPFDDRVKDVVLKYALNQHELEEELTYLNSMGYGCVFRDGPILEQIHRFRGDELNGVGHAPSFRWNRNYQRALKKVEKQLQCSMKLKVCDWKSNEEIVDALPKLDTHAGFEYIKTGLKYKGDYTEVLFDEFKAELNHAKTNGTFAKPILPGFRLQVSGAYDDEGNRTGTFKQKVRLVSMVDLYQILAELMFAKPVQAQLGTMPFYAGGKEPGSLQSLINAYRAKNKYWISLDYSVYDQSLPSWLIQDAFELIWTMFEQSDHTKSWRWLWDIVVHDFINKGFVGPRGVIITAHDGVPSGSMFTQIIDTICNLIMITCYFEHISSEHRFTCIICGDDNLVFSPTEVDIKDVSGYLKRCFGITCHPDKCSHGTKDEDPEFLSRVWRTNGAWREPKVLWSKLVFPERFRPYNKNPQLSPELIVYSYILAFPNGMRELINVDKFLKDNAFSMHGWSNSVLEYQSGYLSYSMRYRKFVA